MNALDWILDDYVWDGVETIDFIRALRFIISNIGTSSFEAQNIFIPIRAYWCAEHCLFDLDLVKITEFEGELFIDAIIEN